RGVRVVALVAGAADNLVDRTVRRASQGSYGRALQGGIRIHEYRGAMLHAKTVAIDGTWASIGSVNLDNRSFGLNHELNLVLYDAAMTRRLEEIFDEDLRFAHEVTLDAWHRRGVGRVLELFVLPFR